MNIKSTIAAIATPPGRGGIGIIRVSGSQVKDIAKTILGELPKPRYAQHTKFKDHQGNIIDEGIAIYFTAPHSFTGEDVLELHGHGGPVVLDMLLSTVLTLGAKLAQPGEFSERAFLNDKLDLTQAEAIADLIDASSQQAARLALRSLQGEFSQRINDLVQALIELRMYVEAAIDFPEEEIDFLADGIISAKLQEIIHSVNEVQASAKQGVLLQEGMTVVIAGRPNAGKSSLLNCLSGQERAIVTDIPGTTRDVLRERIQIDGLPLNIIDTAGLRQSEDKVEQEGIRRAQNEIANADRVLIVIDILEKDAPHSLQLIQELTQLSKAKLTIIYNKIDLVNAKAFLDEAIEPTCIYLSAKANQGIELLRQHLKNCVNYNELSEGHFIARRRHLDALARAHQHLLLGIQQLEQQRAGELVAEELRQAQFALSEITGEFRADDLLGKIFSSFCIGK